MNRKQEIIDFIREKGDAVRTADVAVFLGVTRQYASTLISELVSEGRLVKAGSTRSARYALPEYAERHPQAFPVVFSRTYRNEGLEEHLILEEIESEFLPFRKLPENVRSIFTYAFSEMFNNAIEHSKSEEIRMSVSIQNRILSFVVEDFGIGVFRNIMNERGLDSEFEALQDLLKGKTTTMPKSHSGEGIFFTSKVGDEFVLESYGIRLLVDNREEDIAVEHVRGKGKQGTKVAFSVSAETGAHLNDVFSRYANIDDESDYGFDKTEIQVKLYTMSGVHISRSQARRVLSGLEKFRVIVFDFDRVPVVGQAFVDEIFRVFHNKHPKIRLETENMNDAVRFMVERAGK